MSEDKNLLITIGPLERRCSLYKPYRWAVFFFVFQSAAFRIRKKTLPYRRISFANRLLCVELFREFRKRFYQQELVSQVKQRYRCTRI